ncbi:hypothetical protein L9F63_009871, partial [Diploptera punctata]
IMFLVLFYGAMACAKRTKDLDLTYYQENMKTLIKFLKARKVPKHISKVSFQSSSSKLPSSVDCKNL